METTSGELVKIPVKRVTRFPGKVSRSLSFNLTALGRQLLKDQADDEAVSLGDYVELLVKERSGLIALRLPENLRVTGPAYLPEFGRLAP